MIKFIICDDNPHVLDKLSQMLESIFIKNNIDAEISLKAKNANEVLKYLNENSANVIFFDIELKSDMSGLELAKKIRTTNKSIYFIFLTGYFEYIYQALKVKIFDFLPKPITLERLEATILRLISDMNGNPKKYIRLDNKNTIIDRDSIYYIKKSGMKLIFQTENRTYETYGSFNKIEASLPDNFVRCHKSYIANVNKITDINSNSSIIFDNNNSCIIGPKYKNSFMEVINNGTFSKYMDSIK